MSQQTNYYSAYRPPYSQNPSTSSSSSNYPVRPLPTPGSSSSVHSPYSPPTSATSSRSPPSATTGYSGRFSTGSGGPNVQSPEAIEDSQRWDSPPTSIGFSGRNGGGGGGSSGGSGSLMNTGSFQHSHATSPNFREGSQSGGFDQSLRGAGGYNSRREGSNGSVRRFHLLFDEVSRTHQVVENRLFLP